MSFLTTSFLIAGLLAMAIPIAIHLLARRRRKPVEWAAMRFLMEAYKKHKRRLQIEQLILLAVRCLILALFGAALARPILQATGIIDVGGARTVYLVIDNGIAASVRTVDGEGDGAALDRHRAEAAAVIDALNPGDRVGVIAAARPARALLSPPSTNHADVARLVRELPASAAATDLDGALARLDDVLREAGESNTDQTLVYLLSDFRKGSAMLDAPLTILSDSGAVPATLLAAPPAAETIDNVQVTAIEPGRHMLLTRGADEISQVTVRLARQGAALERAVTRVRLSGDAIEPVEPRIVTWAPGEATAEVAFSVRFAEVDNQAATLTASIDDDALMADNTMHAVVNLRERVRILLVDRRSFGFEPTLDQLTPGQWIRRALEPFEDSPLEVVEQEPAALDIADLRLADVVFVPRPDLLLDQGWGHLRRFVDEGGLVVISPPVDVNVHQWTEHVRDDLGLAWRIALERSPQETPLGLADEQPSSAILRLISSELKALTTPIVAYQTLPVEIEAQAQPVLTFADGSPLLLVGQPRGDGTGQSRGLVGYLSVAPALSWTNLPSKPLMLPLLHELVRQGLSEVNASRRAVAGSRPAVTGRRGVARLVHSGGAVVTVGNDQRASTAMDEPGVYTLEDDTLQPVGRMAVNVEPAAADTNAQSNAAVETWLTASGPWSWFDRSEPEAAVAQAEAKSPIALYVLLAVLGLVILETILARLFSHAGIDGPRKRGLLGTLKTEPTRARSRQDTGALAS